DPGIENVSRADSKRHTPDRAGVRGVRVGAHNKLAGKRVAFEYHRMADSLGAFTVYQLPVEPDTFPLRKLALFQLELRGQVEQAHLPLLLRENFVEERQVIAEEHDRRRIIDRRILSDE